MILSERGYRLAELLRLCRQILVEGDFEVEEILAVGGLEPS